MQRYKVVDCREDENRVLLEGGAGRFHWARVLNDPPLLGELLVGSRPHLGFGLLQCLESTRTVRVVFESVNDRDAAAKTRQPIAPTPSGDGSTGGGRWV